MAAAPPRSKPASLPHAAKRGTRAQAIRLIFDAAPAGEGFSHIVVGAPRYGKTYHAQHVITECIRRGVAGLALVHDAKKTTPQYQGRVYPTVQAIATEPPPSEHDAVLVIHPPPDLAPNARETPEAVAVGALQLARLGMPTLLVIDELMHALAADQHWRKNEEKYSTVAHVLREGGSQGVSFLATTQIPQQLPTEALDLPQTKAVFHLGGRSAEYAAARLGLPSHVFDQLHRLGEGEFFLVTGDGCDGVIYGPT